MKRQPFLMSLIIIVAWTTTVVGQSPRDRQAFHDRAMRLISQLASRPLTPGDTFLTWNPEPGGLIHTIRVDSGILESSLLRADRMMGTAHVEWFEGRVARFDVRWTRADTLKGSKVDSAISVRGSRDGDSIRITEPDRRTLAVPTGWWAVADFGMEEQLIPILRSMPADKPAQLVAVLRPYHLRWDTISVAVRDSAGLRIAEVLGRDKAHELYIIDTAGRLLCVWRIDRVGERLPLPESARYEELQQYLPTVRAIVSHFPVERGRTP